MDRRGFIAGTVSLVAPPLAAEAQQGKVYRIGELREGPALPSKPFADAMRELGWIEGQHYKIERRSADSRDQLPALVAELVRLGVDLILTTGTPATAAAKEATRTSPSCSPWPPIRSKAGWWPALRGRAGTSQGSPSVSMTRNSWKSSGRRYPESRAKRAKALGLAIPQSLLARADELIQ
jgi:hypothetical protein